jgi:hypothetical protein
VRLDLSGARARGTVVVLAVPTRTARLSAQHLIEREGEAFARLRRHDEDVIFGSDDFELFHTKHPSDLRSAFMLTRTRSASGNIAGAPRVSRQA